jgi:acetate kinase
MQVLVVNAGSSSLKLSLLDGADAVVEQLELGVGPQASTRLGEAVRSWPRPDAVGHRIVHGGTEFTGPVRIDAGVTQRLRDLTDLAPLHQPRSLAALDALTTLLPDVPAVAAFDTAFHASIPAAASTYAVPVEWRTRYGIRRYGFHGLSHAYCARSAAAVVGISLTDSRIVTCHLGAGASLAAVHNGRSVDTTMGFTPLDGLVMATRSGSLDPGLVLWLEEHEKLTPHEVATALEHRSGLLALAGTADMREVEAAAARSEPAAVLALDVYIHHLAAGIAAMAAAMGGIDVLAFTGGVGEHSAGVRRRAADQLGFLGIRTDDDQTSVDAAPDRDISAAAASVSTVVIAAREDLEIAGEVRQALGHARAQGGA